MAHVHGNATHSHLRLRDAQDAHVLFQAVRQGHLQLIRKRLTAPEQQALHAGQVFVWADREGSLERWTDGHNWSPSRVRGPFLMYDEMPEDTEAFLRRKQLQKSGERRVKQPRKKRLPPLPGGLSKQTYSATLIQQGIDIQKWHVTAYFQEDGSSDDLPTIDDDPLLRGIIVPENTFKSSMTRKSKGSVSRRRDSMSTGERPILDDDQSDTMASPIDEYPPSPTAEPAYPASPSENLPGRGDHFAPASGYFTNPQGWEGSPSHPQSSSQHLSRGRQSTDSGNGSGSSAGSAGTLQGERSPHPSSPTSSANVNRGRPLHLEGIHSMYDNQRLSFSSLSSHGDTPGVRPSSMPVADWRSTHAAHEGGPREDRRGSLMSMGSSRSASSTSTSQSTAASSRMHPSSDSSPASSWTQQSPYLTPTPSSVPIPAPPVHSPMWSAQQQRIKPEHPLAQAPLYPMSAPTGYHETLTSLPAHLQHHPEAVPSAVPPPFNLPSRKPTLPFTLSSETVTYGSSYPTSNVQSPSQHMSSQSHTQSTNPNFASYGNTFSFGDSGSPSSMADVKGFMHSPPCSPLTQTPQGQQPSQFQYPAAVTASNLPGSWEGSQGPRQGSSGNFASFSMAGYAGGPAPGPNVGGAGSYNPSSHPQAPYANQYTIPGPGEVFESVVPQSQMQQGSNPAYHLNQSWP